MTTTTFKTEINVDLNNDPADDEVHLVKSPTIIINDNEKTEQKPKLTADFRSNSEKKFNEFTDEVQEAEEQDEQDPEATEFID